MGNKRLLIADFGLLIFLVMPVFAADVNAEMENLSAASVAEYEPAGSLFQQITDMEQNKILMQLEKEQAQLDLELDRLAAEKIKLHMEIDTLSGRADEQTAALEAERVRLENETLKLERERERMANAPADEPRKTAAVSNTESADIGRTYRLVNIVGAGGQLQATLEYVSTGQRRKLYVGQKIENDMYTVKSISLADGVTFEANDGTTERLNIGK